MNLRRRTAYLCNWAALATEPAQKQNEEPYCYLVAIQYAGYRSCLQEAGYKGSAVKKQWPAVNEAAKPRLHTHGHSLVEIRYYICLSKVWKLD